MFQVKFWYILNFEKVLLLIVVETCFQFKVFLKKSSFQSEYEYVYELYEYDCFLTRYKYYN